MRISVRVQPNAKNNKIKKVGESQFLIWVKAKPQKGRANQVASEILAGYFGIAKSSVKLLKGQSSRQKLFEVQ